MRRSALVLAALLLASGPALAGKKDKKDKKNASADAPAEAAAAPTELPGDATSAKFGAALMALSIADFKPMDNVGATFVYTTMSFEAGNTWSSAGFVEIADERMECTESGTWTMEAAESASVATVTWKVDKTDCAGRDAGSETRAKLTISKDGIDEALFR